MAFTISRLGAVNLTGTDKTELFMKVFAGEVLAAFAETNILVDKHHIRTIENGKSASFPVTGKVTAAYMAVGDLLEGGQVAHNEKVITIDDLLVAQTFIANLDEAMNHYDVRSIYSTEMGRALSNTFDINVFKEIIKAARVSTAAVTGGYTGTIIKDDAFKLGTTAPASTSIADKAKAIASGLFKAAQYMDEKDVPESPRYAAFRPADYYALAQNTDLINKLYGGTGAISEGNILRVAGITILKSNHVPCTDTSSTDTRHGVNAAKTVGVVWHPMAVGTVKLLDLAMESDYLIQRQGNLFVAKYAMGHGTLRPECAVELCLNTLTVS